MNEKVEYRYQGGNRDHFQFQMFFNSQKTALKSLHAREVHRRRKANHEGKKPCNNKAIVALPEIRITKTTFTDSPFIVQI